MSEQAEKMPEERLVRLEKWLSAHKPYWQDKHSGSGIDSLVDYTTDLIADVRHLRRVAAQSSTQEEAEDQ